MHQDQRLGHEVGPLSGVIANHLETANRRSFPLYGYRSNTVRGLKLPTRDRNRDNGKIHYADLSQRSRLGPTPVRLG
jgi:hypothetical protein